MLQRNYEKSFYRQSRQNSGPDFPFPVAPCSGALNEMGAKVHAMVAGRHRLPDISPDVLQQHANNNLAANVHPLADLKGKGRSDVLENPGSSFSESPKVEGSVVHIMKALASHTTAAQSLIEDNLPQLLFQMVANGSLTVFAQYKECLVPLHTIQLHRHAMQILNLLLVNDNGSTAKYIRKHLVNLPLVGRADSSSSFGSKVSKFCQSNPSGHGRSRSLSSHRLVDEFLEKDNDKVKDLEAVQV